MPWPSKSVVRPLQWTHSEQLRSNGDKGGQMSDDKSKVAADRKRIDVNSDYELRDWSKSLGVSPAELKETVKKVGTSAEVVREHLKQRYKDALK